MLADYDIRVAIVRLHCCRVLLLWTIVVAVVVVVDVVAAVVAASATASVDAAVAAVVFKEKSVLST